jgi:hypothetical protein
MICRCCCCLLYIIVSVTVTVTTTGMVSDNYTLPVISFSDQKAGTQEEGYEKRKEGNKYALAAWLEDKTWKNVGENEYLGTWVTVCRPLPPFPLSL